MKKYWIDSHAHLASDELFEQFDEMVSNARAMEVGKINIICGNLKEIKRILPLIEDNPMFDLSIGVHPMGVQDSTEDEITLMESYYTHPQVVCVGEIGLDYYWDDTYRDLQHAILKKHIAFANKYGLPVAIHLRDKTDSTEAVDDLIQILKENPVHERGVIHCYSDTVDNAKIFLAMGYYLGFGGVMTFKNGDNVRAVLDITPEDRILTETDSPYLAPVPMRGKRNQPGFVSYVGKFINNHRGKDSQELLMDNYFGLFKKAKRP